MVGFSDIFVLRMLTRRCAAPCYDPTMFLHRRPASEEIERCCFSFRFRFRICADTYAGMQTRPITLHNLWSCSKSASGHLQTWPAQDSVSALPLKADIWTRVTVRHSWVGADIQPSPAPGPPCHLKEDARAH